MLYKGQHFSPPSRSSVFMRWASVARASSRFNPIRSFQVKVNDLFRHLLGLNLFSSLLFYSLFASSLDEQVTGILRELGFSMDDISKLYTVFVKIDKDFSGEVSIVSRTHPTKHTPSVNWSQHPHQFHHIYICRSTWKKCSVTSSWRLLL